MTHHPEIDISPYIQAIAEKSRDVFWIRSTDYGKQLYISPAFEIIWGRSREELYNHPERWETYLIPDDSERLRESVQKRNPKALPTDIFNEWYRITRPDGEIRWLKDQSFPIYDLSGNHIGFAGIVQDITQEKQHEFALKQAKDLAEKARLAKTEFIANMSHDLKTPLHAIIGMAEILKMRNPAAEEMEYLNGISSSSQVILKLINDILNFSSIQDQTRTPTFIIFNLKNIIEEALSTINLHASQKNISIILSYPDSLPHQFIGDPQSINRILINLLSNAIKYTDSGYIIVTVDSVEFKDSFAHLKMSIEDSGIGIEEENLPYIFDRFYRVQHNHNTHIKGTGLGLAIAKELVKSSGGEISVNSVKGSGSTFNFTLTLQILEQQPLRTLGESYYSRIQSEDLHLPNSYRILVVEDDLFAQKISKVMLEKLGCKIDIATNGAEAIDLIHSKNYDIIFMDIGLPDITGLLITEKIRNSENSNSKTPIIGLTAQASNEEKIECEKIGMNNVISKPATIVDLHTIILKSIVR